MQDAGPADPGPRTPLIAVLVHGIDVRHVQEGVDGGLLVTLAAEKVRGRPGQDDADREGPVVAGQGLDDDRDWIGNVRTCMARWSCLGIACS